jgi:hypothetical protein
VEDGRVNDLETLRARYRDANDALHRVWTLATGSPGYIKSDWMLLDRALGETFRTLAEAMGHRGPLLP